MQDARQHGRPILIDYWADWCHTCINMKHTVLADPALQPWFEAFTWLSADTENSRNQGLLARYAPLSWPTFFVIDPKKDTAVARFSGGASLTQFQGFLEASLQGVQAIDRSSSQLLGLLARGDQAMRAGDRLGARRAYAKALETAPSDWPRRPDTEVLLLRTGQTPEDVAWCQAQVEKCLPELGDSPSTAEFFYFARQCLKGNANEAKVRTLLQGMLSKMDVLLARYGQGMSVDDQSTLLVEMREVASLLGDGQKARGYALVQQRRLDTAAKRAGSAYEASMYNWPREEVYVFLGQGAALIDDLKASEAALPENYDPPYRLAWLYHKLGHNQLALAAAKRALALVQGPRRKRLQELHDSVAVLVGAGKK